MRPPPTIRLVLPIRETLPPAWHLVHGGDPPICRCHAPDGAQWVNRANGLTVVESVATEWDGKVWHHVSVSRRGRMPEYADMDLVYRLFVAPTVAYQVAVPTDRHVNIHPFCLHWWACLDEPAGVLPDFARGGVSI